jgi:hypothetical protein
VGTHLGLFSGGGSDRRVARDGSQLVLIFGGVGSEFKGMELARKWPNGCGATSSSPTWGVEAEARVWFSFHKIPVRVAPINRRFCPRIS